MFPTLWVLLLAAPPALNLGSAEIVRVDAHLEQHLRPRGLLRLHRGDTVFVDVQVPLRELGAGALSLRLSPRPAGGVEVLPWTREPLVIREGRKGQDLVATPILLSVSPVAATSTVTAGVLAQVVDATGAVVGSANLRFEVSVVPAGPSLASLELDRLGYLRHQQIAALAKTRMPNLAKNVRLDDLELPPEAYPLTKEEAQALSAFLQSRARMEVARRRLRAAADLPDRPRAEAAIRAIASFSPAFKRSAGAKAAPIADVHGLIMKTQAAVEDLLVEVAERNLSRLRDSPALTRGTLAQVLALQGAVAAMRGDDEAATTLYGQARCLDLELPPPSRRPTLRQPFDAVVGRGRCSKPLGAHSGTAGLRQGDHGDEILVHALFGPDPYHVVDHGEVHLLGPGAQPLASADVNATRGDLATLEATFTLDRLQAGTEGVTVQVIAKDMVGIPLASYEAPLVTAHELPPAPAQAESGGLPWWLWVAGGVAVAGAAVATVVITTGGEGQPAIGPIHVSF